MKKFRILLLVVVSALFAFALAACGEKEPEPPAAQTITGVTFTDKTVEYDGQEHEITVTGTVPEGVSVAYTNNKGTDAGVYNATATLTGEGYTTLTLTAKLTIEGKTITGVTFTDKSVTYSGTEQTITVTGDLPEGVSVTYTGNKGTDAGTYNATATLTGTGYNPLTLTAKLTIEKADINDAGITFDDLTTTYDGQAHTLTATGLDDLPAGVTFSYSQNSLTDAGELTVTLTIGDGGKNYNTKTMTAKLTINKATITGVTFAGASFPYDGSAHSIEIAGAVPEGSTIVYSRDGVPTGGNVATETGTYTVTVTITNKNYETYTATATLTITASENERFITYFNDTLYFANARDNDYLYSYNGSALTKVSSDIPYNFTVMGSTLYFRSGSLLFSSIKKIDTNSKSANVFSVKGEYLCTDGTNLYYAVNGLTNERSGIYKLNPAQASSDTYEPTLVSQGKAKYLAYANGKLWFADGNNGWKLSSVPANGNNAARTVVAVGDETEGEKIDALTVSDNGGTQYLFFTVDNLLGNYIANYNTTTGDSKKLTIDAGANLTVIGNELYYINVDLVTSTLRGKGIYKVNAYPSTVLSNITSGTKVIGDEGEKYSSLCSLGDGRIAYYQVSTQDLCIYTIAGGATEKILTDFVAPEVTPLSTGSKILAYGTKIYYLDLYNDKALYCIDTAAAVKTLVRVTSDKVEDFSILGDTLYFNAVSWGVNNDLYKVDLKLGGTPELISKNDCKDIVTDGENIYYGGSKLHKIDKNGTDTEIYSKDVSGLTYYGGYLYFTVNMGVTKGEGLHRLAVNSLDQAPTLIYNDHSVGTFVISDGVVYFRELQGLGWNDKQLSRINVDGTGYRVMMVTDTDPLEITVHDGRVYYYNDLTSSAKSGIYSVSINAAENETPQLLLANEKEGSAFYYARYLTVVGDKMYFINYRLGGVGGDSHLYSVELGGSHTVEKLA